jgi:hypothetical protein
LYVEPIIFAQLFSVHKNKDHFVETMGLFGKSHKEKAAEPPPAPAAAAAAEVMPPAAPEKKPKKSIFFRKKAKDHKPEVNLTAEEKAQVFIFVNSDFLFPFAEQPNNCVTSACCLHFLFCFFFFFCLSFLFCFVFYFFCRSSLCLKNWIPTMITILTSLKSLSDFVKWAIQTQRNYLCHTNSISVFVCLQSLINLIQFSPIPVLTP